MSVVSRGAPLLSAASLAIGLLAGPTAASAADTSTSLSAAEMVAALKAVGTASARASAEGWKAGVTMTGGSLAGSEFFVADPAHRVSYQHFAIGGMTMTQYVVAGRGTYASVADPRSRAALRMMHRSAVRYVFTADRSAEPDTAGVSPASTLADDVDHAGTRVVHADGSTDYRLKQDGAVVTFHVGRTGVLASADAETDGTHVRLSYAYGPQHLTPPPARVTIGSGALTAGLAYLDMPAAVREVAGEAATDALGAARGHRVPVPALRAAGRRDARAANRFAGVAVVKARDVAGGVRVYATNPWTHRTVAYTLTATGRTVTIAKK